ncbi:TRAP transporter substrate-binding protein [Algibacter mikhailovii]|nr:TRAP transporter substrate-binding protein [Algibacter mikhailovii]
MLKLRCEFRFLLNVFVLLLVCLLMIQCQSKKDKEPEFLFRASLLVNENHTWYKGFEHLADLLYERSKGRMKLEVYPSEQLSKEIEAIRLIQAEVIDMTTTGSVLSNWFEMAIFCELPFFMRDSIDMKKFINSSIGQQMEKEMIQKTGLRPVAFFQRGERHLTSNRPIKHPDDLKGLIIRIPNVPAFVTAWSTLGAKPTPMAFSEVFTSLQQGTIEAQENPFALIKSAGFSEVQSYINLTGHVVSWSYPVIGEKQFQKLPKDLQTIFLEAAKDMQDFEHQLFQENEKSVQQELKKLGLTFIEVDKEAFLKKCEPGIYESLSPDMKTVYHQIKKILE